MPFFALWLTLNNLPCCSTSCNCPASWAAAVGRTCSITGEEFKPNFRYFVIFLSYCVPSLRFFPVLFTRALEIPVFNLVYTRLCWSLPFSFPASFIMQLQFVFWLVVCTPYWRSTFDNSNLQGISKKVRVIGNLKQITGIKETSKWMGRKGN